MGAQLEPLPSAAELYEYRRADPGGIPMWLPHNQGDVFDNVNLDLVTGEHTHGKVMLFLHPCTMRRNGGALIERATVIGVRSKSAKKALDEPRRWSNHYSVVPLPDFSGTGTDAYEGDLFTLGTIPTSELRRENRVAVLSDVGRSHMLHRVIYHLTRDAVPTLRLQEATAVVQTELQLQADWCAAAAARCSLADEQGIALAEAEFQGRLDTAWPHASPDVTETIRTKLTSEVDADREDAYTHLMGLIDAGEPGISLAREP